MCLRNTCANQFFYPKKQGLSQATIFIFYSQNYFYDTNVAVDICLTYWKGLFENCIFKKVVVEKITHTVALPRRQWWLLDGVLHMLFFKSGKTINTGKYFIQLTHTSCAMNEKLQVKKKVLFGLDWSTKTELYSFMTMLN